MTFLVDEGLERDNPQDAVRYDDEVFAPDLIFDGFDEQSIEPSGIFDV